MNPTDEAVRVAIRRAMDLPNLLREPRTIDIPAGSDVVIQRDL